MDGPAVCRSVDGHRRSEDWERQFRHWLYHQPEAHAMVSAQAYFRQMGTFRGWPHQLHRNVELLLQARQRYETTVAPPRTPCHA